MLSKQLTLSNERSYNSCLENEITNLEVELHRQLFGLDLVPFVSNVQIDTFS